MFFRRPDRFPYSIEHLGRRVAWVVSDLRRMPNAGAHSSAIHLEDSLGDLTDPSALRSALSELEQGLDRSLQDHRSELRYIRIHLRKRPANGLVDRFLAGYRMDRTAGR
ncbi:MAG: hypothetical protein QM724_06570 [Flavobacteriales bacterium]